MEHLEGLVVVKNNEEQQRAILSFLLDERIGYVRISGTERSSVPDIR